MRKLLVLPLLFFLIGAGCSKASIDNAIKATAAVAATNRAASDLVDAELVAGRIDQPTRNAATVIFKEVARLDNSVLDILAPKNLNGNHVPVAFLSVAGRQSIINSISQMRLRIAAGAFPFIKNEQSRADISAQIKAISDGLEQILTLLPAAK